MERSFPSFHNDRGVALLITLLVTALLIALIFEFAYGTRVSLRAAVNFRDSQRAYFLARSGVNYAAKLLADGKLQELLSQRVWTTVPMVSGGDTELRIWWADETGKIDVKDVSINKVTRDRLDRLFGYQGVDVAIRDRMVGRTTERGRFNFLSELHEIMSDEEFEKVKDFLTVYTSQQINIYSAPEVVLRSAGVSDSTIMQITADEKNKEFNTVTHYGLDTAAFMASQPGTIVRASAVSIVGGYTRQIEAVIDHGSTSWRYWKVL